jgi:hypothetical protein
MTEQTNESTPAAGTAKPKTVITGLKPRTVFPDLVGARAFMEAQESNLSDWNDMVFTAPGVDAAEDGSPVFKPEYYESPDYEIHLVKLMNKGDKKANIDSTVKAIVLYPAPNLERLLGVTDELADTAELRFVREIIRKELNHRAVRQLRVAKDVVAAASEMPLSIDSYVTSQREAGGAIETFDSLYKKISDTMAQARKVWAKRKTMLRKAELRKAMESKAYALDIFPELEDTANGSLFMVALQLGVKAAEREGLDPAIFNRWLENRDEAELPEDDDEDAEEGELELDSMLDAMLTEEGEATESDAPGEEATDEVESTEGESAEGEATADDAETEEEATDNTADDSEDAGTDEETDEEQPAS